MWLGSLVLGWLLLVLWSAEFAWVAFAIFFICVHLLPAVAVVALMTVAVVATQLAQGDGNVVAGMLGPSVGAAVAIGMGLLYERLVAQDVRRRALVRALVEARDDLLAAQDALATAQRDAGAEGLLKDTAPDQPVSAVLRAAAGETVLAKVTDGLSNREVARALFISEATVKSHLVHVFGKLGVESRTAAVAVAREAGLLR
ncbi:LuxR C-terminal-related transcriptional regulator [Mumia quercus]|uniref:LuxR C-terminal-related transcriptional regulator n=1 Tax=Mumia quercus TaxID=2976125 RepID=UPI0021D18001|nr:LuxR C-terminal-related transcriptional regulator [Mumia quercus]